jgi:hypothetical protein
MSHARTIRANAIPEVSLLTGLALLLLFGATQEALFAFDQVTADGATFMAAQKSVALRGSAASLSDAQKVVSLMFPRVKQSAVTIATSSSGQPLFETSVIENVTPIGIPGVPLPQQVAIQSRDVEAGVAGGTAGVPSLCFANLGGTANATYNLGMGTVLNGSSGTLNSQQLSSHVANIQGVQSAVTGMSTDLTAVVTALTNVLNIPLLGPTIQTLLGVTPATAGTYIAALVQPTLNSALTGTATSSQLTGLLSGVLSTVTGVLGATNVQFRTLSSTVTALQTQVTALNTAESGLASITGTSGC